MSAKFHVLSLLVLLFVSSNVLAQNVAPKSVSGGILNEKAVSLPQPPYPAAAKAVRASGAVSVQVTIDEQGNVISASAVSGHPLLRAASVVAARQAKFNPTELSGQPVKVIGVIVYNFYLPLRWHYVGTALGDAETEIETAENLEWAVLELRGRFPSESQKITAVVESFKKDEQNSRAQSAAIYEIINSLLTQLGGQRDELKYFEFGLAFGRIKAAYFDDSVLRSNLPRIKEFVENLPEDASNQIGQESLDNLRALAEFADKVTLTRKDKTKIRELIVDIK